MGYSGFGGGRLGGAQVLGRETTVLLGPRPCRSRPLAFRMAGLLDGRQLVLMREALLLEPPGGALEAPRFGVEAPGAVAQEVGNLRVLQR